VFWLPEDSLGGVDPTRSRVVVAGPGSSLTIPGIVVAEIVRALTARTRVTRLEVDVAVDALAGLHRAPSLAAAHVARANDNLLSYRAPANARLRTQMFRQFIDRDVTLAVAYAWPGIDNDWIRQFLQAARSARVPSVVLCASLPTSTTNPSAVGELAEIMSRANRVLVGEDSDVAELSALYGSLSPLVEAHPSLSLRGRTERSTGRRITAFLPRDNAETLTSVLSAFDAIPEAWIPDYHLNIVMRYQGEKLPDLVAASYYADYVELTGENLSAGDLETLASGSSALSVAEPLSDSRAFSTAIGAGVATVVLTNATDLAVGRGYVGGLLADSRHPASVHVALHHALRLEGLHFPNPAAWQQLALRLNPPDETTDRVNALETVTTER
jgi:hypothetical protein